MPREASRLETSTGYPFPSWSGPPVAILWDQSLVWGLLVRETLVKLGVPAHFLSARDIAAGALQPFRVLLVPGGWASHKRRALGDDGAEAVRRFVFEGGSYLGFCGGAGLALSGSGGLSLAPVERLPLEERLPNASGEVWIAGNPSHPVWKDLPSHLPVSIWWPGQFGSMAGDAGTVRPLAHYDRTGKNFMVADLPVADMTAAAKLEAGEEAGGAWKKWEKAYGINLDPRKLLGQPAIVEVETGRGRLILSYPHLETPGDAWGNRLLFNVLRYLGGEDESAVSPGVGGTKEEVSHDAGVALKALRHALDEAEELIRFGERHLFWNWRNAWLLHWRRGLRGLEYGMLAVCLREAVRLAGSVSATIPAPFSKTGLESSFGPVSSLPPETVSSELLEDVRTFAAKAEKLLLAEKLAGQTGPVTKLGTVNTHVDGLRLELFGSRMNHGGLCRRIFDRLDGLLLDLLRRERVEILPPPPVTR